MDEQAALVMLTRSDVFCAGSAASLLRSLMTAREFREASEAPNHVFLSAFLVCSNQLEALNHVSSDAGALL